MEQQMQMMELPLFAVSQRGQLGPEMSVVQASQVDVISEGDESA